MGVKMPPGSPQATPATTRPTTWPTTWPTTSPAPEPQAVPDQAAPDQAAREQPVREQAVPEQATSPSDDAVRAAESFGGDVRAAARRVAETQGHADRWIVGAFTGPDEGTSIDGAEGGGDRS